MEIGAIELRSILTFINLAIVRDKTPSVWVLYKYSGADS